MFHRILTATAITILASASSGAALGGGGAPQRLVVIGMKHLDLIEVPVGHLGFFANTKLGHTFDSFIEQLAAGTDVSADDVKERIENIAAQVKVETGLQPGKSLVNAIRTEVMSQVLIPLEVRRQALSEQQPAPLPTCSARKRGAESQLEPQSPRRALRIPAVADAAEQACVDGLDSLHL